MNKKLKELLFIILGWVVLGIIIMLFVRGLSRTISITLLERLYLQYFSLFLVIFCINSFVLLPKLYFNHKKTAYFLCLLAFLVAVAIFKPFEHFMDGIRQQTMPERGAFHEGPPFFGPHNREDSLAMLHSPMGSGDFRRMPPLGDRHKMRPDLMSILLYLFLIGVGIAMESGKRLSLTQRLVLQSESERAKAELAFLKAQVNPHFLFNTLNNIYAMAMAKREETPEAIMRLSNIMRYITETASMDFIGLPEEIDCISDYIYLNELRSGGNLDLTYSIIGKPEGKNIAPLILISFVENAFKYGVSKREYSPVFILLRIEEEQLVFNVRNKILQKNKGRERSGLGIDNTTKRLDSLYPGRYNLEIEQNNGWYQVMLIIPFSKENHED